MCVLKPKKKDLIDIYIHTYVCVHKKDGDIQTHLGPDYNNFSNAKNVCGSDNLSSVLTCAFLRIDTTL